ncbi:MAG: hypothetical protein BV458_03460 [Thermoplasmata archaeon M9B2D]|nr:MAG: hypothetical protein BV458_03460 [Thermoplasmata archaeon M9B2D]
MEKKTTHPLKIVKIDRAGRPIEVYSSIYKAGHEHGSPANITHCLRGRTKVAYGFHWMTLDDFRKHKDADGNIDVMEVFYKK